MRLGNYSSDNLEPSDECFEPWPPNDYSSSHHDQIARQPSAQDRSCSQREGTYHSVTTPIEADHSESDPSRSSSSSNPSKATSCKSPRRSANSRSARWQKTYWSGIWMLNARCARIRSTVDRTSTRPSSSSCLMQMSKVMNVPAQGARFLTYQL